MTEPQPNYSDYFGDDGQPVRAGVQLSPDDQSLYDLYFAPTTTQTTNEETN